MMNQIKPVKIGNLEIGKGIPKICVSITGRSKEEILRQAEDIKSVSPDLVEWRGDFYEDIFLPRQVKEICCSLGGVLGQIPTIFTFRSEGEGGMRQISTEAYVNLNQMVSEIEQVQAVDVEVFMDSPRMGRLIGALHEQGKVVVGSHHRFDRTPPRTDMITILKKLELAGADIVKLAVMPHSEGDVKNLMQTTNEATCNYLNRPAITMSMGELGQVSRVVGELIGSCLTFGCVGAPSAPGQIEVDTLRRQMEDLHKIVEKI